MTKDSRELLMDACIAITKLENNIDFKCLCGYLKTKLSDTEKELKFLKDETELRWTQGECIAYSEIVELIDKAKNYIKD